MSMLVEANLELKALSEVANIDEDLYDQTGMWIDTLAHEHEHEHMKVYEFVDMCLLLAIKNAPPL